MAETDTPYMSKMFRAPEPTIDGFWTHFSRDYRGSRGGGECVQDGYDEEPYPTHDVIEAKSHKSALGSESLPICSTMNHDNQSISRATSVSRASRRSSVSRSQSLINKNIAPHDLRPSDVLIERFVAWKAIVKQLIAYFEVCELGF